MGESMKSEKGGKEKVKENTQRIEGLSRYPSFPSHPLLNEQRRNASPVKDEYIYTIRDESAKNTKGGSEVLYKFEENSRLSVSFLFHI